MKIAIHIKAFIPIKTIQDHLRGTKAFVPFRRWIENTVAWTRLKKIPENAHCVAVMHELRGVAQDTVDYVLKERGGLKDI